MSYHSFEDIINSVSAYELQNPSFSESRDLNIAAFGRFVANAHVGWDSFGEEVKSKFKTKIEILYNSPAAEKENLLKELEKILTQCIPDNHAFILDAQKNKVLDSTEAREITDKIIDKYPVGRVGQNTAFTLAGDKSCQELCHQGTEEQPISIAEKTDIAGKKIGIIALSKCPQPSDPNYDLDELCKTFAENYQNWDAVVLDVRGNEGGNDKVLSFITEKLYGTTPRYHRQQSMRMTPESKILHSQKIKSPEFLNKLHEMFPNGYQGKILKEPEFNEAQGYNRNIYVLTDRRTSSSAEFVCGLCKHPKAKFIGENTCGCGEYGDTAQVRLPNGGYLNMGVYKNELFSGIKEGIGLAPTHPTSVGRDAFDHCLAIMEKDFYIEKLKTRVTGDQVKETEKMEKICSQNLLNAFYEKAKVNEY